MTLIRVIPKSINVDRVEDLKDEEWQFVIDVNLHGGKIYILEDLHASKRTRSANTAIVVMYCMRAELQNMNRKGSLINASSIAGIMGFPKNAAYTASKHGRLKTLLFFPSSNFLSQLSLASPEPPQKK